MKSILRTRSRVGARSLSTLQRHVVKGSACAVSSRKHTRTQLSTPRFSYNPVQRRQFSSKSTVDFMLADIGEGIAECEVMQWFVQPGDTICQFDKVCEVQSDKATVEITSRYDGVVKSIAYDVGEMAIVGKPLLQIEVEGAAASEAAEPAAEAEPEAATPAAAAAATPSKTEGNAKVLASPVVRRMAQEHNIDLSTVPGTGPKGRVIKGDILAFIKNGGAPPATAAPTTSTEASTPAAAPTPVQAPPRPVYSAEDKTVPVAGLERIMVKTMNAANAIPQFGYCDDINMDNLTALRKQIKPLAEAQGVKCSYLPFILKATSLALKQYPGLNAHVPSPECTEVIHKGSHNIGLAMDTPRGLLVPNVKNVQDLSILEIARELNNLQALGAAAKLGSEHLTGGTFSLSNIGAIGGTYAKPIVVVPEVMIGALGKIQTLPRYDEDGNVVPQKIMGVSWSADHRVVDGATCARFSNLLKAYLENPMTMMLDQR